MATDSLPQSEVPELEQLAQAVDDALAQVMAMDEASRNRALALKGAIEEFHKAGLTRIIQLARESPQGAELLRRLAQEPTVYALFTLHGLVRIDLRMRVSQVLEQVRPYLRSHGGDVSLVDIRQGRVLVRLSGACQSCSLSTATLKNAVEEALRQRVPEVQSVEAVNDPPQELLSLEVPDWAQHGWRPGPRLEELPPDEPTAFAVDQESVLLLRRADRVLAFRNRCPHQQLPLEGARFDPESGRLSCPWHCYQFELDSGRCVTDPGLALEMLPARVEEGVVWIRPG